MSKIIGKQLRISGGGGINYVSNSDLETNAQGYNIYNDAAAVPIDGTGGVSGLSVAQSSSNPLHGSYSLLITKDAVNRQGEGVSVDFTIESADKAKMLTVDMDFESGGGFAPSDITFYVYDITNANMIQLMPYQISAFKGRFVGTFQSAINSTSYRLICHIASTNALAWTLKLDRVSVGPQSINFGTAVTDWQSYTPTFTGLGTPSSVNMQYRRVGDSIEINGSFSCGTTTASALGISLPSGLTIDGTKLTPSQYQVVGVLSFNAVNSTGVYNAIALGNTSSISMGIQNNSFAGLAAVNGNTALSSGNVVSVFARIPIQGWSSLTQMSDQSGDNRSVTFFAKKSSTQAVTASTTNVSFTTVIKDSHAAWNGTDTYTVAVSGDYWVAYSLTDNAAATDYGLIYLNGTYTGMYGSYGTGGGNFIGMHLMTGLKSGDQITLRAATTTTLNGSGNISIARVSGNQQIAANETVAASYSFSTPTALGAGTTIVWNGKDYDTHNIMNSSTGVFTIPSPGKYRITCALYYNGGNGRCELYKNGSQIRRIHEQPAATSGLFTGSTTVQFNAGETFQLVGVGTTSSGAPYNYMTVERVGN